MVGNAYSTSQSFNFLSLKLSNENTMSPNAFRIRFACAIIRNFHTKKNSRQKQRSAIRSIRKVLKNYIQRSFVFWASSASRRHGNGGRSAAIFPNFEGVFVLRIITFYLGAFIEKNDKGASNYCRKGMATSPLPHPGKEKKKIPGCDLGWNDKWFRSTSLYACV